MIPELVGIHLLVSGSEGGVCPLARTSPLSKLEQE
jgi:hypothetical protein